MSMNNNNAKVQVSLYLPAEVWKAIRREVEAQKDAGNRKANVSGWIVDAINKALPPAES